MENIPLRGVIVMHSAARGVPTIWRTLEFSDDLERIARMEQQNIIPARVFWAGDLQVALQVLRRQFPTLCDRYGQLDPDLEARLQVQIRKGLTSFSLERAACDRPLFWAPTNFGDRATPRAGYLLGQWDAAAPDAIAGRPNEINDMLRAACEAAARDRIAIGFPACGASDEFTISLRVQRLVGPLWEQSRPDEDAASEPAVRWVRPLDEKERRRWIRNEDRRKKAAAARAARPKQEPPFMAWDLQRFHGQIRNAAFASRHPRTEGIWPILETHRDPDSMAQAARFAMATIRILERITNKGLTAQWVRRSRFIEEYSRNRTASAAKLRDIDDPAGAALAGYLEQILPRRPGPRSRTKGKQR